MRRTKSRILSAFFFLKKLLNKSGNVKIFKNFLNLIYYKTTKNKDICRLFDIYPYSFCSSIIPYQTTKGN